MPATPLVTGMGAADDDGPVVVISLLHAGAADAEANAEALDQLVRHGASLMSRQPWSERFEAESITTDGPLMVARLRPGDEEVALRSWYDVFYERDNLITSC